MTPRQDNARVSLRVVPVELDEANALVARWHRHHKPSVGHRFSLGVVDEAGILHGAAIVGRPVSLWSGHPRTVAEVARLVTDGTPNACSMLYAAAARACRAIGFERIQTFILNDEIGTSLRAAGWEYDGAAKEVRPWVRPTRPDRRTDQPMVPKGRWVKRLNPEQPPVVPLEDEAVPGLWDAA